MKKFLKLILILFFVLSPIANIKKANIFIEDRNITEIFNIFYSLLNNDINLINNNEENIQER